MKRSDIGMVLDVLSARPASAERADWYAVLGFLDLNRVAGYFYAQALRTNLALPAQVKRRLCWLRDVQAERNERMRAEIAALSDALEAAGARYAFLKGGVLSNVNFGLKDVDFTALRSLPHSLLNVGVERCHTFYGRGERVSNDVDVLIEPGSIKQVTETLKRLGYVQGYWNFERGDIVELDRGEILSRRMNRGETAPFLKRGDCAALPFIEVDVNFSLDWLPGGGGSLLTQMLDRSAVYLGPNLKLRSLCPEDFLLHLLMHLYKEMTVYPFVERGKDMELYKFLDIWLMLERCGVDTGLMLKRAKAAGVEGGCAHAAEQVAALFGGNAWEGMPEAAPDEVTDPASGRTYRWRLPLTERVLRFQRMDLLEEVRHEA